MIKFNFKNNTIRFKLATILLTISIFPLILFTIIFINYFSSASKAANVEIEQNTTNIFISHIDEWIQAKVSVIQELIKKHPEFKNANSKQILSVLKLLKESDKDTANYLFINPIGEGIDVNGVTINVADREYFIRAKETKSVSIGDMVVSKATNKYVFTINVPIIDDAGNLVGLIMGTVSPDTFTMLTNRIKMAKTGYGYLMSNAGVYYSNPEVSRIGKSYTEFTKSNNAQNAVKQIISKENGSIDYLDDDGLKKSAYFGTIPHTSWKLVVTVPEKEVLEKVSLSRNMAIILLLIMVLVIGIIAIVLSSKIANSIVSISSLMQKVAKGNLTERLKVKSKDEIGQLSANINIMIDSLTGIIKQINSSIVNVASESTMLLTSTEQSLKASAQIATLIQVVASGANIQLEGAEQSARAMEEMANGVQRIAESSTVVSDQAGGVSQEVESGYVEIQGAVEQMNIINASSDQTSQDIAQLNSHSIEIGNIIGLISDISNQTSLLSLNASIEAARAGEHGRGFSVVANEVKKLAEQTKHSVNQVSSLIKQIQLSTKSAATSMQQSISDVEVGIVKMQHIGQAFHNIRSSIREVSEQVQEISAASEQISAGTEEVTASMEEMVSIAKDSANNSKVVTDNADNQIVIMDGISSSTHSLNNMLVALKELTLIFQISEKN